MKKQNKAFTLLELVITIAVVAILAAVLIPTFIGILKRANISSDTVLVKNLNTIAAAHEDLDGKPETAHEIFTAVAEEGFSLEKLSPTTEGYDIAWDQVNNQFALLDENGKVVYSEEELTNDKTKIWVIRSTMDEVQTYATYLRDGYAKSVINATNSVDVGNNVKSVTINIESETATDVTLRTNAGTVNINTPNADVNHYGHATNVNVEAVAMNSYHLHGTVEKNITFGKGRIVVEEEASVNTIILTATTTEEVSVFVNDNAVVKAVAATTEGVITETNVTTPNTTTVVEEVVANNGSLSAFKGLGTKEFPYEIASVEDFNSMKPYYAKNYFYKQVADIVIDGYGMYYYFGGTYDGNNYKIIAAEKTENTVASFLFYGVYGNATIKNLQVYSRENHPLGVLNATGGKYAKNITFENIDIHCVNNKTVTAIQSNFGYFIADTVINTGNFSYTATNSYITFDDCNVYADLYTTFDSAGIYMGGGYCLTGPFVENNTIITFRNCVNYANVTSKMYAGVVWGNGYYNHYGYTDYMYKDTDWYNDWSAEILEVKGEALNPATTEEEYISLFRFDENGLKNKGTISATQFVPHAFGDPSSDNSFILNETYQEQIGGTYVQLKELEGNYEVYYDNGVLKLKTDSTEDYKYKLVISVNHIGLHNSTSSYSGRKLIIDINSVAEATNLLDTTKIHAYDRDTAVEKGIISETSSLNYDSYNIQGWGVALYYENGILNIIIEDSIEVDGVVNNELDCDSQVEVFVYAYDQAGNQKGIKEIEQK